MKVQVELWMSMGQELGGEFTSPSEMVSSIEMDVEEGETLKELFDRLAKKYISIAGKIFDREKREFYPNLTILITFQGRMNSFADYTDPLLKEGYKIMVLPLYAGG
jgi:molybdopterin converting factor small subunit